MHANARIRKTRVHTTEAIVPGIARDERNLVMGPSQFSRRHEDLLRIRAVRWSAVGRLQSDGSRRETLIAEETLFSDTVRPWCLGESVGRRPTRSEVDGDID